MVHIPANEQEFDSLLKLSSRAFGNALMRITGEKPGIVTVLLQDVLSARLKKGILDLPIETPHGYIIEYEFHSGPVSPSTVLRNYQYAIDLRVEVDKPVKPHIVSLDAQKNPIPKVGIFPGVFTDPDVTYLIDINGEKILNIIKNKLNKQKELDYMDAYSLGLIPFFKNKKETGEMLEDMCHFVNTISISEELKYIIKLIQILSVRALFTDDKQKEILGVIKMGSTYIDNYEKNLIKNAVNEAVNEAINDVALKLKEFGVDSEIIFESTGLKL